jgi:tripartite-type tricarboxylate transporter receptor subunit TctC
MVLNPLLMKKLPYDPFRDFAPASLVIVNPQVLVVHPSLPASNVREFIALAKARPGQLNFGSSGVGTPAPVLAKLNAEIVRILAAPELTQRFQS